MIHGEFGDNDELFLEIELITAEGLNLAVDALLDTGFSGWLLMDEQDAIELNWQYIQRQIMMTPKGESEFKIYAGIVEFDGQKLTIPVHVGNGLSDLCPVKALIKILSAHSLKKRRSPWQFV